MPQTFSITTATGVRLDLIEGTTFEINMGGISLLSLADRTITYTNTFRLPRTPTNEKVFGFASSLCVNNIFKLAVTIQKGLFVRSAKLRFKEFGGFYECSVSYDDLDTISDLKAYDINTIAFLQEIGTTFLTRKAVLEEMCDPTQNHFFSPLTEEVHINSSFFNPNTVAIMLTDLFTAINGDVNNDITINLTISNVLYAKAFLYMQYAYFVTDGGIGSYDLTQDNTDLVAGVMKPLYVSDLLRVLCQLFFLEMKVSGRTVTISEVSTLLAGTPVSHEGFTSITKRTPVEYGIINEIKYTIAGSNQFERFCEDVFTVPSMEGWKDVVKLDATIPMSTRQKSLLNGLYDTDVARDAIILMAIDTTETATRAVKWSATSLWVDDISCYKAKAINLSGFYSGILNPIFATPVIVECSTWIDPLKADSIMTSRVIISRQLQGKYWVDAMAYDLTTGRTRMTLIKL